VTAWDIWTNVLLFLPFGWLLVRLSPMTVFRPSVSIAVAAAGAALVSFGIEFMQTLLPRYPSLVDIACNILGALLGGALRLLAYPAWRERHVSMTWRPFLKKPIRAATAGYWAVLCLLFIFPLPLVPDFSNWDPDLRMNAGNEMAWDRAWQGSFYGLALHDRALSHEDVRARFSAGPPGGLRRAESGHDGVVSYDFTEGSGAAVFDRAQSESPVDLRVEDASLVQWLHPQGLAILGATGVSSPPQTARPVHERLSASGEMSLESWVAPGDVSEPGPDVFVSSSNKGELRNFALAQDAADLVFWLRTPLTGLNGRKMELRTLNQPLTTDLQYAVITYASSTVTVYLNGIEQARMVIDRKQTPLDSIVDVIGSYYESGLRSLFLFPLGVLTYLSLRSFGPAWLPFTTALAGAGIIEAARTLVLGDQFDHPLAAISAGTGLVAGITAARVVASE
jgi:glycopeptide antibiotics resistance protein